VNMVCCGDWFPSLRRYRCLANGSVYAFGELPLKCPGCWRITQANIDSAPITRRVSFMQVNVAGFGWVALTPVETERE